MGNGRLAGGQKSYNLAQLVAELPRNTEAVYAPSEIDEFTKAIRRTKCIGLADPGVAT
jgi:hypothetical protein